MTTPAPVAPASEPSGVPATPTPQPAQPLSCTEAINRYWPGDKSQAIAVASAESGLRAGATNHNTDGSTDYGCYQVNSIHRNRVAGNLNALYDAQTNVQVAYAIYSEQGWCPWVAARKIGYCN